LRITRCNITNDCPRDVFLHHFKSGSNFLKPSFYEFFAPDLIAFLASLGIETVTERGNRVFPAGNQAEEVVNALANVKTRTLTRAEKLLLFGRAVSGVGTASSCSGTPEYLHADSVIIATGGESYPLTGSTGDGYRLARDAGHSMVPARPFLVPLETAEDWAQRLQGLSLKNVNASLWVDGKKGAHEFGEMLFTHFGVSGPIILTLSLQAVDALQAGKQVSLSIDLKPALDDKKLDARLLRNFEGHRNMQIQNLLRGFLPPTLIPVCLDMTAIPADRMGNQVSAIERRRLLLWLKDFRLAVTGHRPIAEAIITAGGVNLKEVNAKTMESRLVR
jgi:predicted Rossmann fold flavoprotein